jgi:hypothetical protein
MNANEFISIDDNANIGEEELTDEAIINLIKSNEMELEEQEEQEESLQPKVSILEAINSLDQIMTFIKDLPENFTTEIGNISVLKNLKNQIKSFYKNSKKQTSLNNWLGI